ncbi:hypothetical protein [Paenibacillus sp. FSL L8-0708]|uniref:hypothetical protein n=1 Tax=Paenibacillus sp. FSL L8-0708 TaxID=2975311 RepID=UPI0030FABEE7
MDRLEIYHRSFTAAIKQASVDKEAHMVVDRAVFYGVRMANEMMKDGRKYTDVEGLESHFQFYEVVMSLMTLLTPRRITVIFPIIKSYDGERAGWKDFFSTIKMIENHGWDELIGDPFDLIWDYENWELRFFLTHFISIMSDMRRVQGHPSIAEEWAAENGIPMYRQHTASNGKEYMVDSNGRSFPLQKPRPKHLKIVTGRRVSRT